MQSLKSCPFYHLLVFIVYLCCIYIIAAEAMESLRMYNSTNSGNVTSTPLYPLFFAGFSKQMIQILNSEGVKYKTFDILQDEEVRQGNF